MRITKKIRLPITLKLFDKGILINSSTFHKKSKVLAYAQVHSWDRAYIKVVYSPNCDNDGIYFNLSNLKQVLKLFTEKSLLDFLNVKRKITTIKTR